MNILSINELSKLNNLRLKNVWRRACVESGRIWGHYACDCCGTINSVLEEKEYQTEIKPVKEFQYNIFQELKKRGLKG